MGSATFSPEVKAMVARVSRNFKFPIGMPMAQFRQLRRI